MKIVSMMALFVLSFLVVSSISAVNIPVPGMQQGPVQGQQIQGQFSIGGEELPPFPSFVVGPYTQNAGRSSITVVWQMNQNTVMNAVYWGVFPHVDNITFETVPLSSNVPYLHRVEIHGLQPSTMYSYRVSSDGIHSQLHSFTTARNEDETIHFVAYGDTRQGDELLEGYSYEDWFENVTRIAQSINARNPDLVLHTGDLVLFGNDPAHWTDFFGVSSFLSKSVLYPVLGNHELFMNLFKPLHFLFFDYFSLPNNEQWYSFDSGPVHFIALNSNLNALNPLWYVQREWLIHDLEGATKPWTVVFLHHPLFSSGEHGCNGWLLEQLHPIFMQYGVDVVFSAHDHDYERSEVDGVTYIVTGGGGAPLRDVGHSWFTQYSAKVHHYCLVSANQTRLTVNAVKPTGIIDLIFDWFSLESGDVDGVGMSHPITSYSELENTILY